ncbi:hypothetical protein [Tomitella gaofuii]|uniref:hypothetical protein n=1 Tax=Tomitella gaofuii TaxID=2760083 RepID=UPI0015F99DB9|nr:hypothetical protein [Tomitella gaofuii]
MIDLDTLDREVPLYKLAEEKATLRAVNERLARERNDYKAEVESLRMIAERTRGRHRVAIGRADRYAEELDAARAEVERLASERDQCIAACGDKDKRIASLDRAVKFDRGRAEKLAEELAVEKLKAHLWREESRRKDRENFTPTVRFIEPGDPEPSAGLLMDPADGYLFEWVPDGWRLRGGRNGELRPVVLHTFDDLIEGAGHDYLVQIGGN